MRTVNNSRRLQIANYVKQKGEASVQELSEYFAVSPLTVRRDLTALEEQDVYKRQVVLSPVEALYRFALTDEVLREFERVVESGRRRFLRHECRSLEILEVLTAD